VLAAGDGDRFRSTYGHKLLHPFLGRPLLFRTLEAAREAGIERVTIVIGYEADRVRAAVDAAAPEGLAISYAVNPDWHLENGLSVLAARALAGDEPFVLLMGDHLFEPAVLRRVRAVPLAPRASVLAVDSSPVEPAIAEEATKVRLDGTRIIAIGKALTDYDALDTGMFVCSPELFDALDTARAAGDTTLSGGIRELAARGLMHAFDIGGAGWRDIDTPSDLEEAEQALTIPL
jgi:choline kinase